MVAIVLVTAIAAATPTAAQPMEYVRVCSTYDEPGWYYIPGTETCANADTGETRTETANGTVYGSIELVERANEGIALSMAMQNAVVDPGKTFGAAANIGIYEDANALSISGAMRLENGLTLNGALGVGLDYGTVGGNAGVNYSW